MAMTGITRFDFADVPARRPGLRVVDGSAMPTPPSGTTNRPATMLGWRAATLIRANRDAALNHPHRRTNP